jgi:hypothetical protein
MADSVRAHADRLDEQLRGYLEALLRRRFLLDEPQLLQDAAAMLAAAVPAAAALQALAGDQPADHRRGTAALDPPESVPAHADQATVHRLARPRPVRVPA